MVTIRHVGALALGSVLFFGAPALAETGAEAGGTGAHSHEHGQAQDDIYRGYFEDAQIADRALSDWEGDWQSVYPYLVDRSLDPVLAHKAENGEKTLEEYRAWRDFAREPFVAPIGSDAVILGDARYVPEAVDAWCNFEVALPGE